MTSEILQGEEQFQAKNYLLEIPRSLAIMRMESAPQKLNFVMAKSISKTYTLDCSCKCPFYVKPPTFFIARTIENYAKWMLVSERTFKIKIRSP